MRIVLIICAVLMSGILTPIDVVQAEELFELKEQMKAMQEQSQKQIKVLQKQMQEQMEAMQNQNQKQLQVLQRKIESLEQIKQVTTTTEASSGEGIIERLLDQNIPTLKREWLEIGGELEFEYLDAQADNNGDSDTTTGSGGSESDGRFQIDKFVLTTKVNFSNDVYWKQNIQFAPGSGSSDTNTVDVDNSYLMVKHVLDHFGFNDSSNTYFSIGLKDPFEKPKRITENYNILSTSFHRDEELGIQLGGSFDPVYWRFSMSNGNKLSDRSPNDDSSDFEVIEDNELNADENTNKEVSFGLGVDTALGETGNIDLLAFYNTARLTNEDITFLRTIAGYAGSFEEDSNWEKGLRIDYTNEGWRLWGMYIKAKDGTLDRDGFTVETSYRFKLEGVEHNGRKYLTAIQPVFNYSQYNLYNDNIPSVVTDARTWDREKYIVGLITDLSKNMKLKLEYSINDENTGGDDVKNDEFLAQVELKF
jgi:TolA-binding protein